MSDVLWSCPGCTCRWRQEADVSHLAWIEDADGAEVLALVCGMCVGSWHRKLGRPPEGLRRGTSGVGAPS